MIALGMNTSTMESGFLYCQVNMTVYDLKVVAVYQEGGAGNPTLLFNPIMVSASVLNDSQKLTLMDKDHGYLGIAVDRNQLPSSSTSATTEWLDGLKEDIEGSNYTAGNDILVEYNDLISGTIVVPKHIPWDNKRLRLHPDDSNSDTIFLSSNLRPDTVPRTEKKGDFYPQGHRRNRINSWLNDSFESWQLWA